MMQWDNCFSGKRTRSSETSDTPRTEFQRDFDRLIFASSFRRLQNKTQVFPLPGSTFVHNRLTHSLEVASVGRSLGSLVGQGLIEHDLKYADLEVQRFYQVDLSNVIAAACLAHDIGNPAFGHSGEKAISNYFISKSEELIEGKPLRAYFTEVEWNDLILFEGNANALRVLTHHYRDRPANGMGLTFTTLASILKYPCEASAIDKQYQHKKKYGFFQTERSTFLHICEELHMLQESDSPLCFRRHPYVYLVEAADDICYRIVDMEDAHRLGIISTDEVSHSLMAVLEEISPETKKRTEQSFGRIKDANDSIAYLRAKTINALTQVSAQIFLVHRDSILAGTYRNTLIGDIETSAPSLRAIIDLSMERIYTHHSVVEIEITGYHVMSHLLHLLVPAVLRTKPIGTDRMALSLIPHQFTSYEMSEDPYIKVMSVVDFISGMTDAYATEFYRKTTGIDISRHR